MSAPPTPSTRFDPSAEGWEQHTDTGFIGLVGPLWTRRAGGEYLFGFLAEPKHHNYRGVVQGGMLMTLADRALGMAAWEANEQKPQATVQLDVHFVDAVQIGEFVHAQCKVVRRTKSLTFMSATLLAGERIVLTASGVWKTVRT